MLGGRPRARVLVEASTDREWVARCLEGLGHEVIVADPNFAPMYATRTRKVKTDRRDARALMDAAGTAQTAQRQHEQAGQDSRAEASWRERALNAEDALKAAHAEIRAQRDRIGQLLGQLRNAERDLPQDAVQRITTENTTLKQRVRQLTADNRALAERLEAARSNNRFADRRIAQLEAQLTENTSSR